MKLNGAQALIKIFSAAALLAGLSACQSTDIIKADCSQQDWYELGRRDGANGIPQSHFDERMKKCSSKTQRVQLIQVYSNGRNAGLVEFCRPDNAYELGRSGQIYYYVCPWETEDDFLYNYRRGRKIFNLENTRLSISEKIKTLFDRLNSRNVNENEKANLTNQLSSLRQSKSDIEAQISELKKSAKL